MQFWYEVPMTIKALSFLYIIQKAIQQRIHSKTSSMYLRAWYIMYLKLLDTLIQWLNHYTLPPDLKLHC